MIDNITLYYSTDADPASYSSVSVYALEIWAGEPKLESIYNCEPLNGASIEISGYRDNVDLVIPYGNGFNTGKKSAILAFACVEYKKIGITDTAHPAYSDYPYAADMSSAPVLSLQKNGLDIERIGTKIKKYTIKLQSSLITE